MQLDNIRLRNSRMCGLRQTLLLNAFQHFLLQFSLTTADLIFAYYIIEGR